MKKLYCVICGNYKKLKLSYIFEKTLVLSIIFSKWKMKIIYYIKNIFREEVSSELSENYGLTDDV